MEKMRQVFINRNQQSSPVRFKCWQLQHEYDSSVILNNSGKSMIMTKDVCVTSDSQTFHIIE